MLTAPPLRVSPSSLASELQFAFAGSDVRALADILRLRGRPQDLLFEAARAARRTHWGDTYILRGVIELTNLCRMGCSYCPMRRGGIAAGDHFLLSESEVFAALAEIADTPVQVISFQSGETPKVIGLALSACRAARAQFGIKRQVLLSLGKHSPEIYSQLRDAGATSYIMKFETADPALHKGLRGETLSLRQTHIDELIAAGFEVGTGSIVGLPGQTIESVAADLVYGLRQNTHMLSVSPFIPAAHTPLADSPMGDVETTLNAIAILRILAPDRIIPTVSALELAAPDGQLAGLMAGANVITVNCTPQRQADLYQIYGRDRFKVPMDHALETCRKAGLKPTSAPVM